MNKPIIKKTVIKSYSMELNLRQEDVEKLCCARNILEKEFKYHYTIEELAQKVGTNEFKLKHGFKQVFKITLYEYLTNIRIEKAKTLLECTDLPIKRVAADVGYTMCGNFIRRFKTIMGMSPTEYRKNNTSALSELFENS